MAALIEAMAGSFGALLMIASGILAQLLTVIGTIWLTLVAFRAGLLWALLVFFVPVIGPVTFKLKNPERARVGFYIYGAGLGFLVLTVAIFILRSLLVTYIDVGMPD